MKFSLVTILQETGTFLLTRPRHRVGIQWDPLAYEGTNNTHEYESQYVRTSALFSEQDGTYWYVEDTGYRGTCQSPTGDVRELVVFYVYSASIERLIL